MEDEKNYYFYSASTTAATTTDRPETTAQPSTTTTRPSGGLTTWSPNGVQYKRGDTVSYEGIRFECVHDHTSYQGAEPGIFTWAWWKRID